MSTLTRREHSDALPSGTVTFAFTDVEGSTQAWERDRAAMEDAVRRHDALVREAIAAHGGHVFKTVGDAFCTAFPVPEHAIAAMLDVQRALAAEDFAAAGGLAVRAAVHTGTADERDGDYFGPAVNRVARLLAIGHGGQILVSGVSADLVQGDLPAQATLRDLGEHRLRDLARPEYVYQLQAPDLRATFPALRSLDALPNNLPLQFTSLVGREREIAEITELLAAHRLVTLVGSGGVGKTRTSLQVAANLLDGSGDGVWFIELAPLTSGDYIASAVAGIFGVTLPHEGDPLDHLVIALRNKATLLVFDNCEHMVDSAARVISALLRGCAKVKILASSRQGLGLAGEETYRLPSLSLPKTNDAIAHSSAVALFVERARSTDKQFELTDENATVIADICRRLDGIPLAIELAASRVKILSPRQLHDRLDERFRVLTGGNRDVLPRQQTLRALIDWSHDLLDERERLLFRSLGVFVNGFTLEGAIAVGGRDELDEFEIVDVLGSLVDKSLVLVEPQGDALRYRLLESTRAYAAEKLTNAGERAAIEGRHLRYLRDRFIELKKRLDETGRETPLDDAFEAELEDLRMALDGALVRGDIVAGAELLAVSGEGWRSLGESIDRHERYFAALPARESRLRSLIASELGAMLDRTGRKRRGFETATIAVQEARASDDRSALVEALTEYAWSAVRCERADLGASALGEAEALPLSRADKLSLLSRRAFLSLIDGDQASSMRMYDQLVNEHAALGNRRSVHTSSLNLAEALHGCGDTRRAIEVARGALATNETRKRDGNAFGLLFNLLGYELAVDNLDTAATIAGDVIRQYSDHVPGGGVGMAIVLEHVALLAALRGDPVSAAKLAAYAGAEIERSGFLRENTEQVSYDRLNELLSAGLTASQQDALRAEGVRLDFETATGVALMLIATG